MARAYGEVVCCQWLGVARIGSDDREIVFRDGEEENCVQGGIDNAEEVSLAMLDV